jgi:hypothetical protein
MRASSPDSAASTTCRLPSSRTLPAKRFIYGVDFTCAPRKAKPITAAIAILRGKDLALEKIEKLESFPAFEALLRTPGPWIGGFDFPFSLPRELVRDLRWPADWKSLVRHCEAMSRAELRAALDAYRNSRQAGQKYAHRATDFPAGSSSPMKLVNPPVALMFQEGAPRILASGIHVPALSLGDPSRVALEAYPGLLVRKQLGLRASYKSDTRREQTEARRTVRSEIVRELARGRPLGISLKAGDTLKRQLLDDGSGDSLDAVLCAVQAAWASDQPGFGFPEGVPEGEGWIVSAGLPSLCMYS